MALKTTIKIDTEYGVPVELEGILVKVTGISGDKNKMVAHLSFFDEKGGVLWTKAYSFKVSLSGDNFIAQAYEYLKTLPEFADAIDC